MKSWIIEPRDAVVFRDGAPADGAMRTLAFPWPSTTAGLVRSRSGEGPDGVFDVRGDDLRALRALEVRGPLLAALREDGDVDELMPPAPRDCVWHRAADGKAIERRRLASGVAPMDGSTTDLDESGLELVGPLVEMPEGKALSGPSFWRWSALERWLIDPSAGPDVFDAKDGLDALPREERVHVSIDSKLETARDGQLFSTAALRFTDEKGGRRFGLSVCSDAELAPGLVKLGGRSRLSMLRESKSAWPSLPTELRDKLAGQRRLRVILLTPACFRSGALPSLAGAKVVAAVVDRPLAHSGWDLEKKAPRPARRLAPAGSVYWIEVDDAARWAEEHWMTSLSDEPQDALDGFGLAVMGVA